MIKEIIIVEGKTDTQKLKSLYGEYIKTIETNGLAINEATLNFIEKVNSNYGVIIFTDPDGPGKKIREAIINRLNGKVLNAFIAKDAIDKKSKKIGIAEANDEAIKNALNNLITFDNDETESISWEEYVNNDFYVKSNREIIVKHFGWNEKMSSKTLFKWLNWTKQNVDSVRKILGK